jgi:glycosyltransferase involved in cell wall biosynthesis
MKVLMIAPQPFYVDRGTPMNVRLLCKVLGEAGHSVDLLVFPTGRDVALENVNIIRLPNVFRVHSIPAGPSLIKLAFDVLLTMKVLYLCLKTRYDVIHGIEEGGFLAVIGGKIFRKFSVFDMDSCISDQLQYSGFIKNTLLLKFVTSLERLSLSNSSLIVTVCKALTDKARFLAPEARIVQIEDIPLDVEKCECGPCNVKNLLDKYGLLPDSYKVVYTGNLEKYQGIDLLLKSWGKLEALHREKQPVELILVGGPGGKVSYYKEMSEKLGLKNICWAGQRPVEEMGEWMELAHILVSPRSQGENTPLKIYSYMNSGRPVVATNKKTHTQVLDDSLAFLAAPDPEKFAEAMYEALFDSRLSKQKAMAAQRAVEEFYSYPVFQKKLLDAYAALAGH